MSIRIHRTWAACVDRTPHELWELLSDTTAYPRWWPWLQADALPPMAAGARTQVRIHPPLPYQLDLHVAVQDLCAPRTAELVVDGDLTGRVHLCLTSNRACPPSPGGPPGCRVELTFDLRAVRGPLRPVPRSLGPLLRLGHHLVVARGSRQFARATGCHLTATGRGRHRWWPGRRGVPRPPLSS